VNGSLRSVAAPFSEVLGRWYQTAEGLLVRAKATPRQRFFVALKQKRRRRTPTYPTSADIRSHVRGLSVKAQLQVRDGSAGLEVSVNLSAAAGGIALTEEGPAIDSESIADLRGLGEDAAESVLPRLIGMFLEDGPQALTDLHAAVAAGDARAIVQIAHTVQGSGGYFGAYRFQELCAAMEQTARRGDLAPVAKILAQAGHELQRVVAALKAELTPEPL
jgi:HPt (histidine-containing phosphotransfer) domain-containing protein